jgi:NAD(P)-dependent dehydrogenase (short-subunit alcohol dehydrogenase family)
VIKAIKMPLESQPLLGQIALITGASRGIGRAIAVRLAEAGATTVLAARSEQVLHDVAQMIHTSGGTTLVVPTDVTEDQQLTALVDRTLARYGRIDVLVNNAGGGTPRTPITKARLSDWEWTLRVNLWATMVLSKLVLPGMINRQQGAIINMCSLAGMTGKAGEAAYATAKFGVRGFTQSVFDEVHEYGIKVSAICPGYVDTTMIPPNRRVDRAKMIRPEDVAEAVYGVVTSSTRICPLEIVLQSQYDPLKT